MKTEIETTITTPSRIKTTMTAKTTTPPGREVVSATLHQAVSVPGCIGSEITLNDKKVPGLKMYETDHKLLLFIKGREASIYLANVAVCLYPYSDA